MGLLRRTPARPTGTRLFFATDVHGSDACFRKFLNAAKFYNVGHLVLGGDITGKMLVPIERDAMGRYRAQYGVNRYDGLDRSGAEELSETIRRFGHYPLIGSVEELAALEDERERERIFRRVVKESVARWVQLAEDRLRGTGVRCYMAPGNDDFLEIDSALTGSDVVEFAQDRCIWVDDDHEMITTGYSNVTPWDTERELEEPMLRDQIERMAAQVVNPANLIAVLHAPPFDTEIDHAPQLRADLSVVMKPGAGVVMAPVGSTAVRSFIEDVQPLLGLHGHVHEGKGSELIGRTLCINPGSDYTSGVLAGVIIELDKDSVRSFQFVAG